MKKLYENAKIKIAQYLIQKLTKYQNKENGIKSETVSYLFNPTTNEYVLDNKDNIWTMTSNIKLAKTFDRNNTINKIILKTYNLNKSDNEKLRWMTMIKLSEFNVNLTPVLQINDNEIQNSESNDIPSDQRDISLAELDELSMDQI